MPAAEIYKLADAADPKAEMLSKLGSLDKIQIGGARVLLWTYIRPRKTTGGIILTDKEVKEDLWQGTVGHVLKCGPFAFQDDPAAGIKFGGFQAKVGDWVTFSPGDAKRVQINGIDCRLIEDSLIQMVVPDPAAITHNS